MTIPLNLGLDLTATSQMVLSDNLRRYYALLVNDSDTVCYLMLGSEAVANRGIRLNAAGGSYEINLQNPWTGEIHAVSGGVNKRLTVLELSG